MKLVSFPARLQEAKSPPGLGITHENCGPGCLFHVLQGLVQRTDVVGIMVLNVYVDKRRMVAKTKKEPKES